MSRFSTQYPDYAAIEQQIKRAQAERALYLANLFADAILVAVNGVRRLFGAGATPQPKAGRKPLVVTAHIA